ncbi:hypothetical protein AGR7C_pAt0210 [Agrobacterium deltaense Zutra 3/1]|uniref:Uncharacterized protein n=1 Tax=Agrobacterium deltaense Zutra 3/1 TaxID=1183427 RepID=A0A1S7S4N2_9HYPH|nr:hypothetical protein AGR7C_pAt0210 [Agrobacterium deltaense Zutra 3/1]
MAIALWSGKRSAFLQIDRIVRASSKLAGTLEGATSLEAPTHGINHAGINGAMEVLQDELGALNDLATGPAQRLCSRS